MTQLARTSTGTLSKMLCYRVVADSYCSVCLPSRRADYFQKALQIIANNPLDLPFALLYSCETVTPAFGKRTAGSSDQGGSKSKADTHANSAQIKLVLQVRTVVSIPLLYSC